MLERKVKTKEWWRRVSHTILSMCVVDAYLLMVGWRGNSAQAFMTSRHFFEKLAEQLIDTTFETRSMRKKQQRALARAKFQPDARGRQIFICNKPGKVCMGIHIVRCHPHAVRGCESASEGDSDY
jgi:hypothetical protein